MLYEENRDEDDDRIIQQIREKRLEEMKEERFRNRFGDVLEIARDEWVRHVTEESNTCWVLVNLFESSIPSSRLLHQACLDLAPKFPYVKFVKIEATQAVANYPSSNLPTLFCYHNGNLAHQFIKPAAFGGEDKISPSHVEWILKRKGILPTSTLTENPFERTNISTVNWRRGGRRDYDSDFDEDEDDDV